MKVVPLQHTRLHGVVPVLTLAAAYAVVAWVGLWLAIPPGYATALWPASGLALAGVLLRGARVAPGIWLGSFVVNLWTAWDATQAAALLTSVAIPTSIGVGATVQALVGAALVRRWVGFPSPLTRTRDIGTFLLLGGPLSCLVSATAGVTTLAVSGQIPWPLFVMTWWTWWVGDTLGVLIATPLVLSWLAEPRAIWRRRRLSVACRSWAPWRSASLSSGIRAPRNGSACASSSSGRRRAWRILYGRASTTTWMCSMPLRVSIPVPLR